MSPHDYGRAHRQGDTIVWSPPQEIPKIVQTALTHSVQALNSLIRQEIIAPGSIILDPFTSSDQRDVRGVPCNANKCETHWWGIRVWLGDDVMKGIAAGHMTAGGVAAIFGGPVGELIGFAAFAAGIALAEASGRCGVRFDVSWLGVPAGYQRRP